MALLRNRCTFWILLGGLCRFWQGFTISYYCIQYFAFYDDLNLYGVLNALSVLIGGFLSNMFAGYVSDKYEQRNYRTKSYIATAMSGIGVPVSLMLFCINSSFGFSITMLFFDYLLCEGWISPIYAMIQTVIDVKYKGVALGVFQFGTTLSGTVAVSVLGLVITEEKVSDENKNGQKELGLTLAASTAIPCLLASVCFYKAGIYYAEFKQRQEADKRAALQIAEEEKIEMRSESIYKLQASLRERKFRLNREMSNTLEFKVSRPLQVNLQHDSVKTAEEEESQFGYNMQKTYQRRHSETRKSQLLSEEDIPE